MSVDTKRRGKSRKENGKNLLISYVGEVDISQPWPQYDTSFSTTTNTSQLPRRTICLTTFNLKRA
jgi:hypothetical protein